MIHPLNEDQLCTLTSALRLAAERYDENMRFCWQSHDAGHPVHRLGEQFHQQANQARDLAALLTKAHAIELIDCTCLPNEATGEHHPECDVERRIRPAFSAST